MGQDLDFDERQAGPCMGRCMAWCMGAWLGGVWWGCEKCMGVLPGLVRFNLGIGGSGFGW